MLFRPSTVPDCSTFDCHGNGRCVILHDGSPACVCDDARWTHDGEAQEDGYCANEQCSDELTCEHGGECS